MRILSATHRDIEAAMQAGQFREDLYYRLNVVSLTLPPLDRRREDIPLLANHFLQRLVAKYQKKVRASPREALEVLAVAPWPGNVRQLFNVVEQVCALATSPLIRWRWCSGTARQRGTQLRRGPLRFEREYRCSFKAHRRQRLRRRTPGRPQPHRVPTACCRSTNWCRRCFVARVGAGRAAFIAGRFWRNLQCFKPCRRADCKATWSREFGVICTIFPDAVADY